MASRFLAKKLPTGDFSDHVLRQAATRIGSSYGFSTAYGRAEGLFEKGMRDERMSDEDDGSATSYVADKAKEGVKKATEAAMKVGDTAKETMDGAWKAAKETGENIRGAVGGDEDEDSGERIQVDEVVAEVKDVNQPVDTSEYRGIEELRNKAGGYDKAEDTP